jgi:hypothetical protein
MKKSFSFIFGLSLVTILHAGAIDRKAVVNRHNIRTSDITQILALGNGEFCFGLDGTGLQTFGGNVMAGWAWHSFPLPGGATMADVPETGTIETGRLVGEMKQASAKPEVSSWMFRNPHKFNMGRFRFTDRSGKALESPQINNSSRTLDLWKGIQIAEFTVNGKAVKVTTLVHPFLDMIATRIESELLGTGDLRIALDFSYPVAAVPNELQDRWYGKWDWFDHHRTRVSGSDRQADFIRELDQARYQVRWQWSDSKAVFKGDPDRHAFRLTAAPGTNVLEFVCAFSAGKIQVFPVSRPPLRCAQTAGRNTG